MADKAKLLAQLDGWLNEPYRQDRVLAAARSIGMPFLLREVVAASGIDKYKVQRCLSRLVKKGILTRYKIPMSHHSVTGGQGGRSDRVRITPGGAIRRIYLYSFTEAGAE